MSPQPLQPTDRKPNSTNSTTFECVISFDTIARISFESVRSASKITNSPKQRFSLSENEVFSCLRWILELCWKGARSALPNRRRLVRVLGRGLGSHIQRLSSSFVRRQQRVLVWSHDECAFRLQRALVRSYHRSASVCQHTHAQRQSSSITKY